MYDIQTGYRFLLWHVANTSTRMLVLPTEALGTISLRVSRVAGDVVHAQHQQPGGGDAAPAAAEAGEEAAAVPLQGRWT